MQGKRGGLVCSYRVATLAAALLSCPAAWCAPPPPAPEVNITGSPWRPGDPLFISAPLPDTGACLHLLLCQTCACAAAGEACSAEPEGCTRGRFGHQSAALTSSLGGLAQAKATLRSSSTTFTKSPVRWPAQLQL